MKTCEYCSGKIIFGKHDNCEMYYRLLGKLHELDYCKKQCDPIQNPLNSYEFRLPKLRLESSISQLKHNIILRYSTICRINCYFIFKNELQKAPNILQPFMKKLEKINNRCTNLNDENELDLAFDIKTILGVKLQ